MLEAIMKKNLSLVMLVVSFAFQTALLRADSWTPAGYLKASRSGHTATLLRDGTVLIAGGERDSGDVATTATAEIYDPVTQNFTVTGNMGTPRYLHTATLLQDGTVLIAGGKYFLGDGVVFAPISTAEIYDPAAGSFTSTTNQMSTARVNHTATLLPNGNVLIAGGLGESGVTDTAEIYDPAADSFTSTTNQMSTARANHTATLLPNGKVLITGGYFDTESGTTNTAEIYDPATNSFTTIAGTMSTARAGHTAKLLQEGKVLIAGGFVASGTTNTAEIYDPVGLDFTTTGSMGTDRHLHTATLLNDGRVLITGGETAGVDSIVLNSAELFDPVSQIFSGTQAMSAARELHTATMLSDGNVLVVGGSSSVGEPVTSLWSAELFQTPPIYNPIALPLNPNGGTNLYQFASNLFNYKVAYPALSTTPSLPVDLVVQPVLISQEDLDTRLAGQFSEATLVPYDGTGGFGVLFRVTCQDSNGPLDVCPEPSGPYTVHTSWDGAPIVNPAFLKAEIAGISSQTWENILTSFSQDRTNDATAGGRTKGSFSDFVVVQIVPGTGTPPTPATVTITTPVNNATYALYQSVPASYSCSPSGTNCIGPVDNGAYIDTLTKGDKTFEVNATVPSALAADYLPADKVVTYHVGAFGLSLLYDPSKPVKSGWPLLIALELRDVNGKDVSLPRIRLKAVNIALASTNAPIAPQPSGFSKSCKDFLYFPWPGSKGRYFYALNTMGLRAGSYLLQFTVSADSGSTYSVPFKIK
jgi:hypothetical protein